MFQFFRRRDAAVRWFLGGLLVLVCVTMVITLIPGATTPSGATDAETLGTACGEKFSVQDVQAEFQAQLKQTNQNLPANLFGMFAPQILKRMMDEAATDCVAREMGLTVTQEEVASRLRANPGIFPGGEFIGADRYREVIETRLGITVEQFENNLRQEILRGKVLHIVTDPIMASDAEADAEYHRQNDKVKVDYVVFTPEQFAKDVKTDPAKLQAFFERTKANFKLPERRKLKYVVLDPNVIRERAEVSPADIQGYYDRNRESYRVKERVQIAQIMVQTKDKNAQQLKDAEKKIQDLLARARKGEDFGKLAKENSEDPTSAERNGEVGFIARGQAIPEMEKAAFSLQPGQISDVVKSSFGLHIIKVEAHEQARTRTLPEVQIEIMQKVKAEKGERALQGALDQLEAAQRKTPKDLQAIANAVHLNIMEDPAHKRSAPFLGMGASPAADDAVFALKPGEVSGVITVGDQHAVFQVLEVLPARDPEFAEVKDDVEKDYKPAEEINIMNEKVADFEKKLKAAGDLRKAAKELKYDVKTSTDLNAEGRIEDFGGSAPGFPAEAIAKKVGDTGGPIKARNALFYQVVSKTIPTPEETAKNRDSVRDKLTNTKRTDYFQVFVASVRERMTKSGKYKTNDQALQRLKAQSSPM